MGDTALADFKSVGIVPWWTVTKPWSLCIEFKSNRRAERRISWRTRVAFGYCLSLGWCTILFPFTVFPSEKFFWDHQWCWDHQWLLIRGEFLCLCSASQMVKRIMTMLLSICLLVISLAYRTSIWNCVCAQWNHEITWNDDVHLTRDTTYQE